VILQPEAIAPSTAPKRRAAGLKFWSVSKRPLLIPVAITCLVLYGAKFLFRKKERVKLNVFPAKAL
jgi:hypothetical protein